MQTPIMGTFGASSSAAGTNVGVADGNAPVMAMVAPVSLDSWSWPWMCFFEGSCMVINLIVLSVFCYK